MTSFFVTSGNQGIAAAMIGAAKGYKVVITVSGKISEEKKDTLKAYGAELVVCKPTMDLDDAESYHAKALLRKVAALFCAVFLMRNGI